MSYDGEMRDGKPRRKQSGKRGDGVAEQPKFRYINTSPTKDQKKSIVQWSNEFTLVLDALDLMVNGKCSLSVKYSDYNDCFVCSCTNLNPASVNYGAVVTSYASLPNKALFTTLWFVSEVFGVDGEWPRQLSFDPDW